MSGIKNIKFFILFHKGNSLYLKLLFYFLLLLVPVIVIGLMTYITSVNMVKEDFQEKIAMNMEAASVTIDLYINSAQATGADFFNDEVVLTYLVPRSEQTDTIKTGLWRIPKIIQRSTNIVGGFADGIFAFVDDEDVYVSGGLNEFDTYFDKIHSYREYSVDFWKQKLKSNEFIELLPQSVVYDKNMNTKKTVIPVVLHKQGYKHEIIMVFDIDINAIEETLKGNSVFNSTAFLVVDDQNRLIYDSHGFYAQIRSLQIKNGESGEIQDKLKLNGEEYLFSEIKSDLYGWRYYAITPAGELKNLTKGIIQMTVVLSIVFVIVGIFLSFLFSSNIYDPIKKIRDTIVQRKDLLHISEDEKERMNELEMIRSSIHSIVDDHIQFKEKHNIYTNEYIEYSLLLMLKGHKLNDKKILEETLYDEFDFSNPKYVLCSIFFDFNEFFYEDIQECERAYVLQGIKKVLQGILREYMPAYVMEYRQNIFVCVVGLEDNEDEERVNKGFEQILSLFNYDEIYCDITVGVGGCIHDLNDLKTSFNESMTAITKRDKDKHFQIIHAHDISITEKFIYTFYDEQKLLNCLKAGDADCADSVIDAIFDKNIQVEASYEQITRLSRELYLLGTRFMAERGIDIKKVPMMKMNDEAGEKQELGFVIDTNVLKQNVKEYYHEMIEISGAQSSTRQGSLVSMITKYIEENYMKDLCLDHIADKMGVSAKYVSRVFRNNTGMLLTDYINEIRINKAKELLRDTELKIQDIAVKIGIENRTTFLRVFKKMEGVSPTVYRVMHSK